MPGPWRKYGAGAPASDGPWSKYREKTPDEPPQPKNALEAIGDETGSIYRGMTKRGIGLIQTADALTGGNLLSPQAREAAESATKRLNAEGEGKGLSGFIGEAAGDPLSWANPQGGIIRASAVMGASSGLTNASDEDKSGIDRLKDAATGGAIGAATGGGLKAGAAAARPIADVARGITDRVLAAAGSVTAADHVAYRILANRLLKEGKTPEEVAQALAGMRASGLGGTLGEATGSTGVLAAEANLKRGAGKGANRMSDYLATRANKTIPEAITQRAESLIGNPDRTQPLYRAAADEAAQLRDDAMDAVTGDATKAATMTMGDAARLEAPSRALDGASASISQRLSELGDVNSVERKALTEAKRIIENARRRGADTGDFNALLDAKKQLDDLFIEGADAATQKQANRYVTRFAKSIGDALDQIAPNTYPAAKAAAKEVMAGRQLRDTLADTAEGGIGSFYRKVWAVPEQRADFLSKLPDQATRDGYTRFFSELEKVARGHGGAPAGLPGQGHLLEGDIIGAQPWRIDPSKWLSTAARGVGDLFAPQVRDRLAAATTDTSPNALAEAMRRLGSKGAAGQGLSRPAAIAATQAAAAATGGGSGAAQPSRRQQDAPIKPPAPGLIERMERAESGGNPNAKNPNSSASGPLQFTNDTWAKMVARYGKQTGITLKDKGNPEAQRVMGALLARENGRILGKTLGREPDEGDLYTAHFLGAPDAIKLIQAQGSGRQAILLFPRRVVADNRAVFFDGKRPRTVEEVFNLIRSKVA